MESATHHMIRTPGLVCQYMRTREKIQICKNDQISLLQCWTDGKWRGLDDDIRRLYRNSVVVRWGGQMIINTVIMVGGDSWGEDDWKLSPLRLIENYCTSFSFYLETLEGGGISHKDRIGKECPITPIRKETIASLISFEMVIGDMWDSARVVGLSVETGAYGCKIGFENGTPNLGNSCYA